MDIITLLKKHEGTGPIKNSRYMPYKDTVGKTTIGYGRNLDDVGISEDEAVDMLHNDVLNVNDKLKDRLVWFSNLDHVRQMVLIDMAFNMGVAGLLTFKITLGMVERGDYKSASKQMLASKWAKQVGARAIELSKMMETGK